MLKFINAHDCICGVMVSVLASSVVDSGSPEVLLLLIAHCIKEKE
jgi:hypothetical protein